MQMSGLTRASARARVCQDRRWKAAGLLPTAMPGALGCESGERGQVAAAVERIRTHSSRNGHFDRGAPCKCPI